MKRDKRALGKETQKIKREPGKGRKAFDNSL
jgi:hypothetical protein